MKDPAATILQACLGLARAETHTGALEWLRSPVSDLPAWIDAVEAAEKRQRKRRK